MGGKPSTQIPHKSKDFDSKTIEILKLKPLINKLKQKYYRYSKDNLVEASSQNEDLINLQQEIRKIYMGVIKEKIMLANQNKINIKQCKIQISQEILSVQIMILKHAQSQVGGEQHLDILKNFHAEMAKFLVILARFVKTIYPRAQNVQAGQLAKEIKQFDYTQQFQFDILKNANFVFNSTNQFEITNTIKLFLNQIMKQLDKKFPEFQELMIGINKSFKIGRKISQNTSRYVKLDTGTVEINSTEISRVLIKWMQDLSDTINNASQRITPKNEYKFYKIFPEKGTVQFAKCEQHTIKKFINNGNLVRDLQDEEEQAKEKATQRKSKFRKFNMHLMKVFNNVQLRQSQVSTQMMQIIKYSAFNSSFIAWMVEQQLMKSISQLVKVSRQFQDFRGVLDLVKFKIFDLMRCQIYGDKKTIWKAYKDIKQKEAEDKIQVVKIKNRFSTPMGDAMIFFKFPDSFIICECQLILSQQTKDEDAKKAKNIQTLNHFLYELQRSPFGVLGQISNFLTAKSKTVSLNCDNINLIRTDKQKILKCYKLHNENKDKVKFKQQKSPFVCSSCLKFFKKLSNKLSTYYCSKCVVFLCNNCMQKKFEITQEMICQALNKRIDVCHQELKRTKLYRQNPHTFDFAFKQVSGQELIKQFFDMKKIKQVEIIKDSFKNNQVKVLNIMNYINSREDYVKVYMDKGVKVNFGIITWRDNQTRFKCYRYQNDQMVIQNVFQPVEKYVAHQFIEVYEYDFFVQFRSGGFCTLNELNRNPEDGFQLKVRALLERGLFLFEGQTKQLMISTLEKLPEEHRNRSLLKYFVVNSDLNLIVDIAQSLKRSNHQNKIKEYLSELAKNDQQKKTLKMTEMNITNASLKALHLHPKWIKNVKSLSISNNNISEMEVIFETCKSIEKLDISKNRFKKLRFSSPMPSLVDLNGSENSIERVVNFYNVRKIETLNLKSNKIECLTRWVEDKKVSNKKKSSERLKPKSLEPIRQTTEGQKENAQTEGSRENVQSVSLIESILGICMRRGAAQTQIGVKNLDHWVLQDSSYQRQGQNKQQEEQPEEIQYILKQVRSLESDPNGAYIYLRHLVLANNYVKTMKEFAEGYYPNLVYLDMSDNLLQEVPALDLDKLQEVRLANNCISKFADFAHFENDSITTLDFKNNKINHLPKFLFYNLNYADFSYNLIKSSTDFMAGNYYPHLSNLYLSHIDVDTLLTIPDSIKILSLQNCHVSDDSLDNLLKKFTFEKLKQFYLTRNNLTKLPNIENLPKLNSIFLEENPIKDISAIPKEQEKAKHQQQKLENDKDKNKKKKQDQDDDKTTVKKKKGQYLTLSHLWLSLDISDNEQFNTTNQKLKEYLTNTELICWKYDNIFGAADRKPVRKFQFLEDASNLSKQLIIKRIYLLNIFQSQDDINDRFIFNSSSGLYSLEHQWDNIDMNEFIKYDWNEVYALNLTGSGMDDTKWQVFVENANLFLELKEIVMWEHKITTIKESDLESFKKLEKFIIFESNAWSNPLTQESKEVLKRYQKNHPKAELKFEDEYKNVNLIPRNIKSIVKQPSEKASSSQKSSRQRKNPE